MRSIGGNGCVLVNNRCRILQNERLQAGLIKPKDDYMGVSLNGGTPISHPKMIIFSRKPMAVGYHHFRKPPYDCCIVEGHPWQVIHEGQKVPEVLKGCSADPAMFEVVVPKRSNQQERKLMSQESLWCHGWLMITESPTFPEVLALPASMFSSSSVPTTTHNPLQNDTGHTGVQSSSLNYSVIYPVILGELRSQGWCISY